MYRQYKIENLSSKVVLVGKNKYLSVIWVPGCDPVHSRVWLLTLTFTGGSGGEGSAERQGCEEPAAERISETGIK